MALIPVMDMNGVVRVFSLAQVGDSEDASVAAATNIRTIEDINEFVYPVPEKIPGGLEVYESDSLTWHFGRVSDRLNQVANRIRFPGDKYVKRG